jgi:transposase
MGESEFSFLPLQVVRVGVGGKRTFDTQGKRRLIEACRQPGVSVAGMALKAGVNANQLRKWMRRSEPRETALPPLPAFLPVVAIDDIGASRAATPPLPDDAVRSARPASSCAYLTARLTNGNSVELAFGGQHEPLLRTMLEALGAPGCSASTRR